MGDGQFSFEGSGSEEKLWVGEEIDESPEIGNADLGFLDYRYTMKICASKTRLLKLCCFYFFSPVLFFISSF